MLTSIGKTSKSIFIKILVGIIILPFVFWGMGDVFRGGNQNIVATIDSHKVSTQEFMRYLNRLNLSEQESKSIAQTDLLEKILSEYIGRKIISLEVEDMGINISDASLKDIITSDKTFYKDGIFSRTKYEKFLLESSLSAVAFEQNIIEQEKRRQLLSFLSSGANIPYFVIENEFRKENQIKTIKYIDLDNFYKQKPINSEEVQKIYNENKSLFVENFKILTFAELSPNLLTGENEYSENYFNKVNIIENDILDGKSIQNVANENNLQLKVTESINFQRENKEGGKIKNIDTVLFKKIFSNTKTGNPELINLGNKYYIGEITKIEKINRDLNNKEVKEAISKQVRINNIIEGNSKIVKDITIKNFTTSNMDKFAKKNNLNIKELIVSDLKDTKNFTEGVIKRIYETKDGELNLITDSRLSQNYIIHTIKTELKKLDKKSDDFKKYESKARLNFANNIYNTYDKSVNIKYNIVLNNKTIDRIKNSF